MCVTSAMTLEYTAGCPAQIQTAPGPQLLRAVDPTNQGAVAVAGSTVVWEDHRTGSWHLRGYDLTAQREFAITDGPDDDLAPAFDGGAVAFVRQRATGGFGALILRDLGSGEERTIVAGHPALRPGLDGNLVVWEDWGEGVPNVYAFDRESNRSFALARSEQARGPAVAGGVVAWLSRGQFSSRVTAIRLDRPLPSDPQDPPTVTDPDTRYFPESKHTLRGAFRNFWNLNGGLEVFGYPLTEAFEEPDARGVKRQVQYFERARLEADPQDPSRISIARLGAERATGRAFPTIAPFDDTPERAYFGQTGHSLGGAFKTYWENHGGLASFGFPLSEELDEGSVTVQYFERARFEFRPTADAPDRVALSLLGRDALLARGWLPVAPPQPLDR